jgi:esterase/lipase superfamily enzyme
MDENQDQQYVDGGYREEIVFELPSDFKNETISGKQILQTKALFGVFCYCKEKAGYYTIQEGTITKTADAIVMEIPAIIEGQKVRTIKFVL